MDKKEKNRNQSEVSNDSSVSSPHDLIPKCWFRKDWRDESTDGLMDGWLDDGAGLISERLGLMGSAAVGEIVQTRHVVCRKSMWSALYRDKINKCL